MGPEPILTERELRASQLRLVVSWLQALGDNYSTSQLAFSVWLHKALLQIIGASIDEPGAKEAMFQIVGAFRCHEHVIEHSEEAIQDYLATYDDTDNWGQYTPEVDRKIVLLRRHYVHEIGKLVPWEELLQYPQ